MAGARMIGGSKMRRFPSASRSAPSLHRLDLDKLLHDAVIYPVCRRLWLVLRAGRRPRRKSKSYIDLETGIAVFGSI